MKTFDLFNTLVASRFLSDAGEALPQDHIPIMENIAKVKPEDVVVSDYYNPEKARHILQDIAGLSNALIVTEDGKARGSVWTGLKSEGHLGDNPHSDFNSPRGVGISAQITHAAMVTERERQLGQLGLVVREARLKTWNDAPKLRALQLHQIERNFPFLHAVAVALNALMLEKGYTRLLLCSRDCYLLYRLMNKMFFRERYEIEYFHTSRLTRYRPTASYAEYAKERLSGRTLIADMNGSGRSLKHLCDEFGGDPLLVVGTLDLYVPQLVQGGIRETSNLAPHPMVSDVIHDPDYVWTPVYENPTGQNWQKPEIIAMQDALLVAADCLQYHTDIQPLNLNRALSALESPALEPLWADHYADSKAAYDLLNSGALPHPVIL